jgi:hypothetical protein
MVTPKKVWQTCPQGTLSSEANGFRLSIERSVTVGYVRFVVLSDPGNATTPPSILASGEKPSALLAMAAAEQAAAAIRLWPTTMRNGATGIVGDVLVPTLVHRLAAGVTALSPEIAGKVACEATR